MVGADGATRLSEAGTHSKLARIPQKSANGTRGTSLAVLVALDGQNQ